MNGKYIFGITPANHKRIVYKKNCLMDEIECRFSRFLD